MSSREELIEIASRYLYDGLLEHRPEEIPLAPTCVRSEMGWETGGSAEQLRDLLRHDAYKANKAIKDPQWVVEEPFVDVRYNLELHGIDEPILVFNRFEIRDGLIQSIDAMFYAGAIHAAAVENTQALRTDT